MRKSAPINIVVHYPTTEEGQRELRRRVAIVRADAMLNSILKLKCSDREKLRLLNAIIRDAKEQMKFENQQKENSKLKKGFL